MCFIMPVPSIYARPNRKYFGPRRGVTWLNMINDQAAGLEAKVVSGMARDSLHMMDLIFAQEGGRRPEIIAADTGSYSDVVFGLVYLLGMEYRPALADLLDQKLWRTDPGADHGPLNTAARARSDLARVRRHWDDILRVVASVNTGAVAAYDVVRMRQRDGSPTPPSGRPSPPTGASSSPSSSSPTPATRPTGGTSRASATSKRAATHWPGRSSTARVATSISTTTKPWRTNSVFSA